MRTVEQEAVLSREAAQDAAHRANIASDKKFRREMRKVARSLLEEAHAYEQAAKRNPDRSAEEYDRVRFGLDDV